MKKLLLLIAVFIIGCAVPITIIDSNVAKNINIDTKKIVIFLSVSPVVNKFIANNMNRKTVLINSNPVYVGDNISTLLSKDLIKPLKDLDIKTKFIIKNELSLDENNHEKEINDFAPDIILDIVQSDVLLGTKIMNANNVILQKSNAYISKLILHIEIKDFKNDKIIWKGNSETPCENLVKCSESLCLDLIYRLKVDGIL